MLVTVLLLACAAAAAVTDLLWNKIYNWNSYGGIAAALALSAWHGWSPLTESVTGLLACGLLMVVCFAVFPDIGGGDVKLMAMLGTWLGWDKGIEALLWTFVLAGALAFIGLIWKIGPLTAASRAGRLLANKLRLYWFAPLSAEERKALKPPIFIAPSALAAVVIVRFELMPMLEQVLSKP
jgi:leader peptidase (prepilin peptidase)/N-methyltransferase